MEAVDTIPSRFARLKRDLIDYYLEARRFEKEAPVRWRALWTAFPEWRRQSGLSPLEASIPWLTYPAIRFLRTVVKPGMRVFEFGSGGSTLFFARLGADVTSVEHDPEWHDAVEGALAAEGFSNCTVLLKEPQPPPNGSEDPGSYASSDRRYAGLQFLDYASSIDDFPPNSFDVVLIDGRARPDCLTHAVDRLRTGGYLVLDNAERSEYEPIHIELNGRGWKSYNLAGPGPFTRLFWSTWAWRKG